MPRTPSRNPLLVLAGALLMVFVGLGSRPAEAVLSLYDDFNDPSHLVRADLWNNALTFTTGGLGSGVTDSLGIIDALIFPTPNPKLLAVRRLVVQPGASAASDFFRYQGRNAPTALGIQADVTMITCLLSTFGTVQAGLSFLAFNDGASTGPGDGTGDIFARFRLSCTNTNQPEITWNAFRCTNAVCDTAASLGTGSFGPVGLGQEVTLNVSKSGSSFVFAALGQTQSFPVPGNPTAPPRIGVPLILITRADPAVPSAGGDFAVAATFDNVRVDR